MNFVGISLIFLQSLIHKSYAGCSADVTDMRNTNGTITSPNYPNNYDNNLDCTYSIISPTGKPVTIVFLDFDVEYNMYERDCPYDYVEVQDGNDEDLGKFCGSKLPDPLIAMSGTLIVKFHSDDDVPKTGFSAVYDDNYDCLQITNAGNGEISSPRHPDEYPNNAMCIYLIQSVDSLSMKITFTSFDIESSLFCRHDRVLIKDSIKDTATRHGPFCRNKTPLIPIVTTGILVIIFISDQKNTRNGFSALVDYVLDCSGQLNVSHGIIQSPNYPQNYKDNADCTYQLSNRNNNYINLTFTDFLLEDSKDCKWDFVEIRTLEKPSEKLCGYLDVPFYRIIASNSTIVFHSDVDSAGRGFLALFKEITEPSLTTEQYSNSARSTSLATHPVSTDFASSTRRTTSLPAESASTVFQTSSTRKTSLATEYLNTASESSLSVEFTKITETSSAVETDKPSLSKGQTKEKSQVPIIIGTAIGLMALTLLAILLIFWYKRRKSNHTKEMRTAFSNENYSIQFTNDSVIEQVPYTNRDTGYCNAENGKSKINVVDQSYDLADVIAEDQASEININSKTKHVVDDIDQEESYNILNANPKKFRTTEIYDRTTESLYDSTKQDKDDMDKGLYDHTSNSPDHEYDSTVIIKPSVDGVYN